MLSSFSKIFLAMNFVAGLLGLNTEFVILCMWFIGKRQVNSELVNTAIQIEFVFLFPKYGIFFERQGCMEPQFET